MQNNEKSSIPYHFVQETHKNFIFLAINACFRKNLCNFAAVYRIIFIDYGLEIQKEH